MRAYSNTKRINYPFQDHKFPNGSINWWEAEGMNGSSKKTPRQKAKKEIMEVIRLDEEHVSKACST